ncbi:hypothetical protein ANTPLA_LOCUS6112 [Anthophora plagiata]
MFAPTTPIHDDEKPSMNICQSFDKKHEPETTFYTDFDVKHDDHMQINSAVNTPEFRPIIKPKLNNDISEENSKVEQPPCHNPNTDFQGKCIFKRMNFFENTNTRQKEYLHSSQTSEDNSTYWNNHSNKVTSNEKTRGNNCTNDTPRYFTRTVQKPKKDAHKRIPTPRSNVHTAYTPMVQSPTWNPILDPNGLTIQLLRLAVLLYAPTLMPALNSLIARQSVQTSIPIPCSEGANDLLAQIFTILNNQQRIPNLSYVSNPRIDESSHHQETNLQNSSSHQPSHSENITKQFRNDCCDRRTSVSNQFEKNSIAVNTSLEICDCANMKESSSQYNENISHDQKTEEKEKLMYTWTDKKSKSSETVVLKNIMIEGEEKKDNDAKEKQEEVEFSANPSICAQNSTWAIDDFWKFESNAKLNEF